MDLTKTEISILSFFSLLIVLLVGPNILSKLSPRAATYSDAGLQFESNLIPLEIYISTGGEVSFGMTGPRVPTPIGTFTIYANVSFPDRKTQTVVAGDKKYMYDLHDIPFRVSLPNDLYGKSKVEYEGRGNIAVVVPKPVWSKSKASSVSYGASGIRRVHKTPLHRTPPVSFQKRYAF